MKNIKFLKNAHSFRSESLRHTALKALLMMEDSLDKEIRKTDG